MRFLTGILAGIVISLIVGFFPSAVEAKQSPCDPDSDTYDARACFEYVQALEAKSAKAKSDLATARREATTAKSQLATTKVQYAEAALNLGFDIDHRERLISSLGTQIEILSEEKETAWGYVNAVLKLLAAIIGLVFLAGIVGLYLLRRISPESYRNAIEMKDEKIRDLENALKAETDARIRTRDSAAILGEKLHYAEQALREPVDLVRDRARVASLMVSLAAADSRLKGIRQARALLKENGGQPTWLPYAHTTT